MAAFPYEPLDPGEDSFRLLMLRNGLLDAPLEAELFDSFLSAPPAYSALSYTWDVPWHELRAHRDAKAEPQPLDETLSINGRGVPIKPNLAAALQRIRRPDRAVVLWVDALCIDQSNDRERGHQVQQMSKIYRTADEVLVWLGEHNDGNDGAQQTEPLFALINALDDHATRAQSAMDSQDWATLCRQRLPDTMQSPPTIQAPWVVQSSPTMQSPLPELRLGLQRLLGRRWFTRVWVLQEVAMARMARVLCGELSCPARTFALMPSLLGMAVAEQQQAVLDIMPRYRQKTWWAAGRPLSVLLSKFAWTQASRRRDCVYALLGLSTDACDPATLYPHYDIPEAQAMRNVASVLLFGAVLDDEHAFPTFALHDLRHSVGLLVLKTLLWVLEGEPGPGGGDRAALRRTGARLVRRINEGALRAEAALVALAMLNKDSLAMLHLLRGPGVVVDLVCGGTDEGRDLLTVTSRAELCPDAQTLFRDKPGLASEPERQLWLASTIEEQWPMASAGWAVQQSSPEPDLQPGDNFPRRRPPPRMYSSLQLYAGKQWMGAVINRFMWLLPVLDQDAGDTVLSLRRHPQLVGRLARHPRYTPWWTGWIVLRALAEAAFHKHPQIASQLQRYPWLIDKLDAHPWLAPMLEQHPWLAAELERRPQLLSDIRSQPLLASQLEALPAPGPRLSLRIVSFAAFSAREHGNIKDMTDSLLAEDIRMRDWAAGMMAQAQSLDPPDAATASEVAMVRQASEIGRRVLNYSGDGRFLDHDDSLLNGLESFA